MDYNGTGRDQLLSTQRFVFGEEEALDRVEVEVFGWVPEHSHMVDRTRTTYRWDGDQERWWTRITEFTGYEYAFDRLEKQEYHYVVYDVPEEEQKLGEELAKGAIGEFSAYDDLLGRRIATFRAETEGDIVPDYQATKGASIHYDYYGLSQRVAMVRQAPFSWNGDTFDNNGDQFLESYTYSPVGPVVRTDEGGDVDDGNNIDHWVAADLWGGTTSLLLYTGEESDRVLACQHFDAWGVRVGVDSTWSTDFNDSRYRWRSQEGSETDDLAIEKPLLPDVHLQPPSLVYMQSRHYDPGLGRFIMADSIPMGAFSPQGLNRYAYCLNDPVNASDASGKVVLETVLIILIIAVVAGILLGLTNRYLLHGSGGFNAGFWAGFWGVIVAVVVGALLSPIVGGAVGGMLGSFLLSLWNHDDEGAMVMGVGVSCILGGIAGWGANECFGPSIGEQVATAVAGFFSAWFAGLIFSGCQKGEAMNP